MTALARWREFRAELSRVSWPSWPITLRAAIGVLYLLVIVILFLAALDLIFNFFMRALTS